MTTLNRLWRTYKYMSDKDGGNAALPVYVLIFSVALPFWVADGKWWLVALAVFIILGTIRTFISKTKRIDHLETTRCQKCGKYE